MEKKKAIVTLPTCCNSPDREHQRLLFILKEDPSSLEGFRKKIKGLSHVKMIVFTAHDSDHQQHQKIIQAVRGFVPVKIFCQDVLYKEHLSNFLADNFTKLKNLQQVKTFNLNFLTKEEIMRETRSIIP